MNLIDVNSVSEMPKEDKNVNFSKYTKYLFHGTRRWFLEIDSKTRDSFFNSCKEIIRYVQKNLDAFYSKDLQKYLTASNAGIVLYGLDKCSAYEYGDVYITVNLLTAINFSLRGAGELGDCAYYVAKAIKELSLSNDANILKMCDYVITLYNEISSSDSVVLAFKDIDYHDLKNRSGANFYFDKPKDVTDEEYLESIKEEIESLYEHGELGASQLSFRLTNLSYNAFCIRKHLYETAIEEFVQ